MTDHPNPPAFPGQPQGQDGMPINDHMPGMTLRDWFAGQAMPAIIRQIYATGGCADGIEGPVSAVAYIIADAMLAVRVEENGK